MPFDYRKLSDTRRLALQFHLPTFLILSIITLGPLLYAVRISFFDFRLSNPGGEHRFVGFKNYIELFTSKDALFSIWTTFRFMFMAVSLEVILGIVIALCINTLPGIRRYIFTSLILIPMMLAPLVVGLMFNFFFNPQFGLYAFFVRVLHLPLPTAVLNSPKTALFVVALTDVWEWTPFLALMFMAGLQSIPGESFEAAKVDGANSWQTFYYITVPLMAPIIFVGLVLRAMEAFKEFDKPYILTGGGPGTATEVIDMYTYRQAFVSFNFSKAAAICIILFIILLVCGILYGKFILERNRNEL